MNAIRREVDDVDVDVDIDGVTHDVNCGGCGRDGAAGGRKACVADINDATKESDNRVIFSFVDLLALCGEFGRNAIIGGCLPW